MERRGSASLLMERHLGTSNISFTSLSCVSIISKRKIRDARNEKEPNPWEFESFPRHPVLIITSPCEVIWLGVKDGSGCFTLFSPVAQGELLICILGFCHRSSESKGPARYRSKACTMRPPCCFSDIMRAGRLASRGREGTSRTVTLTSQIMGQKWKEFLYSVPAVADVGRRQLPQDHVPTAQRRERKLRPGLEGCSLETREYLEVVPGGVLQFPLCHTLAPEQTLANATR